MSEVSHIEWTDETWNPVTGCDKVSQGCKHCYAERFAERFRGTPGHPYEQGFDLKLWHERLSLPLEWKEPKRIFVNSMSDLFHERVPLDFILRVFETMGKASWHTFQILTKRAKRAAEIGSLLPSRPNIWQGVSVENSEVAWRIDALRQVPAPIRFLSLEPLIGPLPDLNLDGIHWVIVGGESGPRARSMNPCMGTRDSRGVPRAESPIFLQAVGRDAQISKTAGCSTAAFGTSIPGSRSSLRPTRSPEAC